LNLGTNSGSKIVIETAVKVPKILKKKHILELEKDSQFDTPKISQALLLSKSRVKTYSNTVFENIEYLLLCYIEAMEKRILISPKPLQTFHCEKRNGKWTSKEIGFNWAIFETSKSNYHFSSNTLSYKISLL